MSTATQEKPKVKAIPDGMHSITPHLVCDGAVKAIEFYKKAFHATGEAILLGKDGKVMHAQVTIGDSPVMLVDEFPDWGMLGPKALGGSAVAIHLYVENVDEVFEQAVEAGAEVVAPLADTFWGDRYGKLRDPFGHIWSLATHIRDVGPDEMREGMEDCG